MQVLDSDNPIFAGIVRPGDHVMWGQTAAKPVSLTRALFAQRASIGPFKVFLGSTWSDTLKPEYSNYISFSSYCCAASNRVLAKAGMLDVLPCNYSQFGDLIRRGIFKVDVLLLQLSPPDSKGRYSLSMAHEYLVPALDTARIIVAEINAEAPWAYGATLTEGDIDFAIHTRRHPVALPFSAPRSVELAIAGHVAALIDDGATLQVGIGTLPEAILAALHSHRDLGIHSGTIGDQVAALAEAGVITNARKSIDRGLTIAGVMMGGEASRRFVHRNPSVEFHSVDYTHNASVLTRIDNFVAINSALEVDLTGQVNAEVAGGTYIGAVGGAVDFLRGAHLSRGGMPVIALCATAGSSEKTISRIVTQLSGPVSTPRCDAGVIVTEYGVADLRGLPVSKRMEKMIGIAHPEFRPALQEQAMRLLEGRRTAVCS